MVPDANFRCYALEYFCREVADLRSSSHVVLTRLASREISTLVLADPADIVDAAVARHTTAYPMYDHKYGSSGAITSRELKTERSTLHVAGRNGMHGYNDQNHSTMTAILTAENIVAGRRLQDVWKVTEDVAYGEAGRAGQRAVLCELRMAPAQLGDEHGGSPRPQSHPELNYSDALRSGAAPQITERTHL